jgi:hypothetical protein
MLIFSPRSFHEQSGIVIGFPMAHADTHKDNLLALRFDRPKGQAYVLAARAPAKLRHCSTTFCDIVGLANPVKRQGRRRRAAAHGTPQGKRGRTGRSVPFFSLQRFRR